MTEKKIGVLIVDDHEVVRMGLRSLLSREPTIEVIGEAGTAAEAVVQAARLQPDVIIMDVRLPDESGVEACREIRSTNPKVQIMMLTSHAEEDAVFNSIVAGASGFLLKQVPGRDVVRAVETVATGQSLLDPAITLKVMEKVKKLATGQGAGEISQLSAQEQKVLALVAEGKTNREIARALGLSDKTVRNYLSHVFEKLHLSRRAEAAAFFARQRIKSS